MYRSREKANLLDIETIQGPQENKNLDPTEFKWNVWANSNFREKKDKKNINPKIPVIEGFEASKRDPTLDQIKSRHMVEQSKIVIPDVLMPLESTLAELSDNSNNMRLVTLSNLDLPEVCPNRIL